ncbi:RNA polymerase II-associated factor 1 [Galdieria sulphuraria]|uniref:RNA polymerase II-associated factor 1 homolog n=1 Tax=Galdieria sulphuraria TaxID=130081 RepID=M2VVM6_GALSU|nr:uncharacterized protein Gasu_51340 [Galdieria sulphuraria]EME27276.1 hypothetical protein Gasu_51340 [Galdieria sulphuraria]GJD11334.1 RNA polymerase II-associated factor 1 [Galdieria sulphuraria]|eukprot:XP_005703796.1 hypothetical protein Gasu_51340 [Galdieria sulphuraria]
MSSSASSHQHQLHRNTDTREAGTTKAHHSTRVSSRRTATSGTTEKPPSVFLCKPRYMNNLPEPPFLPKMYNLEVETSQYAKYRISSLESSYKPKLETGPALGIWVDWVTPEEEQQLGEGEPLTAEEEEILAQVENSQESKRKFSVPSWMRRTGYDEFSELRANKNISQYPNSDGSSSLKQQRSLSETIQDEFEAAKQVPVHPDPRKRHLKPVQVLPVFPDFENWPDKFVVLQFDSNPSEEIESHQDTQRIVEEFIENALTVAFTNQSGERFLSYYIPTENTIENRKSQHWEETMKKNNTIEDYELLREYTFVTRPEEGNRSFVFLQDDQVVRYFPVTSKLFLYRRIRRQETSQPGQPILWVHRRPFTEKEENERNEVITELYGENNKTLSENTNAEEIIRQLEEDE